MPCRNQTNQVVAVENPSRCLAYNRCLGMEPRVEILKGTFRSRLASSLVLTWLPGRRGDEATCQDQGGDSKSVTVPWSFRQQGLGS